MLMTLANLKFCGKAEILWKTWNSVENLKFCGKPEILWKTWNSVEQLKFYEHPGESLLYNLYYCSLVFYWKLTPILIYQNGDWSTSGRVNSREASPKSWLLTQTSNPSLVWRKADDVFKINDDDDDVSYFTKYVLEVNIYNFLGRQSTGNRYSWQSGMNMIRVIRTPSTISYVSICNSSIGISTIYLLRRLKITALRRSWRRCGSFGKGKNSNWPNIFLRVFWREVCMGE